MQLKLLYPLSLLALVAGCGQSTQSTGLVQDNYSNFSQTTWQPRPAGAVPPPVQQAHQIFEKPDPDNSTASAPAKESYDVIPETGKVLYIRNTPYTVEQRYPKALIAQKEDDNGKRRDIAGLSAYSNEPSYRYYRVETSVELTTHYSTTVMIVEKPTPAVWAKIPLARRMAARQNGFSIPIPEEGSLQLNPQKTAGLKP